MVKNADDRAEIDRILASIKNTIENKAQGSQLEEDVIELTQIVQDNASNLHRNKLLNDHEIKATFKEVLRPYLQSWLAANLPTIVREVVEAEVKKLIAKNEMMS